MSWQKETKMGCGPALEGPMTETEHREFLERFADQTCAVPGDQVRDPVGSVRIHIEEAKRIAGKAREDGEALVKAGMPPDVPARLHTVAEALVSAQHILRTYSSGRMSARTAELAATAKRMYEHAVLAAQVAFRNRPELLERLGEIKQMGDSPAALPDAIGQLLILLSANQGPLKAVGYDTEVQGRETNEVADNLRDSRTEDQVVRESARIRDVRNRLYVITLQLLSDIRAFASLAFRDDPTGSKLDSYRVQSSRWGRRSSVRSSQPASPASPTVPVHNDDDEGGKAVKDEEPVDTSEAIGDEPIAKVG